MLICLVITIKLFKNLKIDRCNLVQYDMLKIVWLKRKFSSSDPSDSQPFKVYVNEYFLNIVFNIIKPPSNIIIGML
jgi:hypothetical protein